MPEPPATFDPLHIKRPVPALLKYYLLVALSTVFGFPFVGLYLFFKYETLRYRFDDEGVSMAWGLLFRREITLAYRRIQDIHVSRYIVERWMGLATVSIQTASGASGPQMQIQGVYDIDIASTAFISLCELLSFDGGAQGVHTSL